MNKYQPYYAKKNGGLVDPDWSSAIGLIFSKLHWTVTIVEIVLNHARNYILLEMGILRSTFKNN